MAIDFFDVQRADALMAATGSTGCADHGDPACLCDVVVESPTPITDVPPMLFNFGGRDDFIRLAELMMGKLELCDTDRIAHYMSNRVSVPDPEQFEWLWATHWDQDIRLADAGAVLGCSGAHVGRLARAFGLKWVTRNRNQHSVVAA